MDFIKTLLTSADAFDLFQFSLNLFLTIVFSYTLSILFQRFSLTFSDKRRIAGTFVLLAVSTMCVITVVKSSLALSLGLVGALSIVRFRTAIKEPEELVYLFMVIVIGLSFGANQTVIGTITFFVAAVLSVVRYYHPVSRYHKRYAHLIVRGESEAPIFLQTINDVIKKYESAAVLRRSDNNQHYNEAVIDVSFDSLGELENALINIRKLGYSVTYISSDSE